MARQIAYVLLNDVRSLDQSAIADALKARHPNMSVESVSDTERPGGVPDEALILRYAGELIVIMAMPMPIPKEDWEQASLRAKSVWLNAPETFANHRAHLIVSTLAESSDRLRTARSLSAVVGGLIAAVPSCLGVLWDSLVAHHPEFWLEASRDVFAPYPKFPYPLWVSLHPFSDKGGVGLISFGLSSFVEREIEVEPYIAAPAEVTLKAAGLTVYLIQNGAVLKDGDTFGANPGERILIRHEVSKRVHGLAVLHAITDAA